MGIQADSARATIRWPRQQEVPPGGTFNVYKNDGADGAIDYDTAINLRPIPAWPAGAEGKIGFGIGRFGENAFGFDGPGMGFGQGCFGLGYFGIGADWIRFTTPPLADGTPPLDDEAYEFAAVGTDEAGNETTPATETVSLALAGPPDPAADLAADSYTSGTDTLSLAWTLSADDDG